MILEGLCKFTTIAIMHTFLEIVGIIVVSLVALYFVIKLLGFSFFGPQYNQNLRIVKERHFKRKKRFKNQQLIRGKYVIGEWTKKEDDELMRLYNQHYSIDQISDILGIHPNDINKRIKHHEQCLKKDLS